MYTAHAKAKKDSPHVSVFPNRRKKQMKKKKDQFRTLCK